MDNMKPEIVYNRWTIIDGIDGVSIYPGDISIIEAIENYGIDWICSIEVEYGWAYRLSMPGYLDCTDWIGPFDWKVDAQRDCDDMLRMEA